MSAEKIILQRSVSQKRVDFIRSGGQRHFSAQGTANIPLSFRFFVFTACIRRTFLSCASFFPHTNLILKIDMCLHRSFLSFSDSRTLFSAATGLYRKNLPLSAVSHINRRGQRRRKRNQNSIYVFLPKKRGFSFRSVTSIGIPAAQARRMQISCRHVRKIAFSFYKIFSVRSRSYRSGAKKFLTALKNIKCLIFFFWYTLLLFESLSVIIKSE